LLFPVRGQNSGLVCSIERGAQLPNRKVAEVERVRIARVKRRNPEMLFRDVFEDPVDLLLALALHASHMRSDLRPYQVQQGRFPANLEGEEPQHYADLGHRGLAVQ